MKKLVLGFAIAASLMVGIAGSAGATKPDCNIVGNVNFEALLVAAVLDSCDNNHPVVP